MKEKENAFKPEEITEHKKDEPTKEIKIKFSFSSMKVNEVKDE